MAAEPPLPQVKISRSAWMARFMAVTARSDLTGRREPSALAMAEAIVGDERSGMEYF